MPLPLGHSSHRRVWLLGLWLIASLMLLIIRLAH